MLPALLLATRQPASANRILAKIEISSGVSILSGIAPLIEKVEESANALESVALSNSHDVDHIHEGNARLTLIAPSANCRLRGYERANLLP